MKTNISLVIAFAILLASLHVGCLKAQRIIDTSYYRYAHTPLADEFWLPAWGYDDRDGAGAHVIDSVSMCTKDNLGFVEFVIAEPVFNGYWKNPLPHGNIDIYGGAIFLDRTTNYHRGDCLKIYICEKSEDGTHFETLDSIVLDENTIGMRRYMIHPFSIDVMSPEYEYDSINYTLYPIPFEDCTQFDTLAQVLEIYFDHPVHIQDSNLYWKFKQMTSYTHLYFSIRGQPNYGAIADLYNEDCTFRDKADTWDLVMAITEPLPQWEQDSLEVLITDVIHDPDDPDDPDNPGGDEGIGEAVGVPGFDMRPNPTGGMTTITSAEPISELTVRDMAGRVVLRKAACGATATFDTSTFRKGVYLVKVTTARGTTTKKLVVE